MATKANLTKAAKELNELFGLDPAINLKAAPKELEAKIMEATQLLEKDDNLSSAVLTVLGELDWEPYLESLDAKEASKLQSILRDRGIWVNDEEDEGADEEEEEDEEEGEEEEEEEKPVKKAVKEKTKTPAKEKGPSQTGLIRDLINKKKKRDAIVKALEETFEKTAGWAEARMKIYEKAYGDMGKDDPKL